MNGSFALALPCLANFLLTNTYIKGDSLKSVTGTRRTPFEISFLNTNKDFTMKFICPKCSLPLTVSEGGVATCPSRHTYDRSREGYYNLLLGASAGTHGDNREMVDARRTFLDTGAYSPLAERIAALVCERARDGDFILDVGSGEGYYTDKIYSALYSSSISATVHGFDVSKEAVKYAARKNRAITYAVASAYRMPIADGSVDIATNVFSPLAIDETARVLRSGGTFIMAIPDECHLMGLKRELYRTPYKNEPADTALPYMRLIKSERVRYEITLDTQEKIYSLFMMTPYAYRTPREARERLLSLSTLTTEVEFIVLVYERL